MAIIVGYSCFFQGSTEFLHKEIKNKYIYDMLYSDQKSKKFCKYSMAGIAQSLSKSLHRHWKHECLVHFKVSFIKGGGHMATATESLKKEHQYPHVGSGILWLSNSFPLEILYIAQTKAVGHYRIDITVGYYIIWHHKF